MQHNIVVHTHHDGEDANQFSVNVEAPTLAAAMASVKQTSARAMVAGWKHFDEIVPAWIRWWPAGCPDQMETTYVTATEVTD
jgi:hypothetical protein